MTDEILFFARQVPDDGYQVIEIDNRKFLATQPGLWAMRKPLEENPTLYREFAGLSIDLDAVLDFANRWGHLGLTQLVNRNNTMINAESVDEWFSYVIRLKRVLSIRDQIEQGAREFAFVKWPEKDRFLVRIEDEFGMDSISVDAPDEGPDRLKQFVYGDTYEPALHYLQKRTDEVISKHVAPRILWNKRKGLSGQLETRLVPNNLLGAIFYQFSRTVGRNVKHRPCGYCGKWFEYQRETAKFCSAVCRTYASQKRTPK